MPTVKSYKYDNGYYIQAWTSDLGNITYQIRPSGYRIIDEYGLEHGDEIDWPLIHSLKEIGVVYTDGSGTLGPDDFAPRDTDLASLTEVDAEQFVRSILQHKDLSDDKIADLCEYLGVERPEPRVEQLEDELESWLSENIDLTEFKESQILNGHPDNWAVNVDIFEHMASGRVPMGSIIGIRIQGEKILDNPGIASHGVLLEEDCGLCAWTFEYTGEYDWERHAEMAAQKSKFMPVVVDWLKEYNIDLGTTKDKSNFATFDVDFTTP